MKKITLFFALLFCVTAGFAQTFTGANGAIPDNNCDATNEFTVSVTGIGTLGTTLVLDQVDIDITHTWDSDIDVTLISPDGTEVDLTSDNGGSGDDYTSTVFRDDATEAITAGSAPFTGTYLPEQALTTFNGIDANGDWILRVCDDASGDTGTLNSWSITFDAPPTCPNPSTLAVTYVDGFTADLAWTETGVATTWNIELVDITAGGTATGTATSAGVTTNPFNVTGLTPENDYEFYVQSVCGGDVSDWIGPFAFSTTVACPDPSALTVTNITTEGADLGWTAGGSEALWDIEIVDVTAGGTATGTATATGVTNPHTVSGLTDNNDYEFYVRADCDANGTSTWVGPFAFTTACTAFTAPYSEDFENAGDTPDCWLNNGDENWLFADAGTGHIGNNGTITGASASNGYFAWVDASGEQADAVLTSPFIDVAGLTTPSVSFYLISDNEGNANSDLDVSIWDGAAWNSMATYNTNTAGWEQKIIDISGLTITGNIQVRFTFTESMPTDFYDDIAIDDVVVDELPTCIVPSGLAVNPTSVTEAMATWTAGDSETAWNYEYGVTGFTQGSGTTGTVNTTPSLSLSSLTEGETYDIYIQADCGGDTSDFISITWTQPVQGETCETAIMVNALPYNTTDDTANFGDDYSGSPGANGCGTTSSYLNGDDVVYAYTAAADGTINIAMSAIGDTYSGVFVYTDCASIGTECVAGFGNGNSTNDYDFNVDVTNGTTYYIVISTWASPQSTTYTLDITEVLCSDPTGLSVSNITETTAEFSWTDGGSPNAEYAIVPAGSGEPASGTAITADTYSASSLTASTSYDFYVRSDCGGGQFSNWVMINFYTGHCIPDAGTSNLTYIDTVTTTNGGQNIDNTASGFATDNYADNFSTMTVSAAQDGSFDFNVEIVGGTVGCAVWVDWNNDFIFEASEAVFSTTSYENGPFTATVTVPNTVANGDYRMRMMIDWNDSNPGDDSACALASGRGEIEDYKLTVDSSLSIADVEATAFKYYPNPVNNVLTINAQNTIQNVAVYNMLGQEVLRSTPNTMTQNVDMSALEAGAYFVQVTINDTAKTIKILKK